MSSIYGVDYDDCDTPRYWVSKEIENRIIEEDLESRYHD